MPNYSKNIGKSEEFSDVLSFFDDRFERYINVGMGWSDLVRQCHNKLKTIDPDYKVMQIKEKFGGLRYYFSASNPAMTSKMHDLISEIERKSYLVCELCGKPGNLRRRTFSRWLKTLCSDHAPDGGEYVSASVSF